MNTDDNIFADPPFMPTSAQTQPILIPDHFINTIDDASENWQVARDRVLLYIRTLNLPPYKGVEFALESLKRSQATDIQQAMRSLRALLHDNGLDVSILDTEGYHLSSMPPIQRGVMIVNNIDRLPYITLIKNSFFSFIHALFGPVKKMPDESENEKSEGKNEII